MSSDLVIAGITIKPGEERHIEIPSVHLYTDTPVPIPVYVKRSLKQGPTIFVSAAIHGDELNGVEIIGRLLNNRALDKLKGTIIAVPMVNLYGVINQSRYLPDRRDLNRSFPGSPKGSLAGRIANLFLTEVVKKCDFGIDLHTGAIHRTNLPQVRANLDDPDIRGMADAFGVPVLLNSNVRDGSLRGSATDLGVKVLLYEAGEALRFDELSIMVGVKGILNVMRHLGMLPKSRSKRKEVAPFIAHDSTWIRASDSGIVSHKKQLGDYVKIGDTLAIISNPYGKEIDSVKSTVDGIIIGKQNIPLAQEGEAMYHIAYFNKPVDVIENIEIMQDNFL